METFGSSKGLNPKITFSELYKKFGKKLSIVATCINNSESKYFNDIIDQKLSYLVENKIEKILDNKIPKLLKNYFDSK